MSKDRFFKLPSITALEITKENDLYSINAIEGFLEEDKIPAPVTIQIKPKTLQTLDDAWFLHTPGKESDDSDDIYSNLLGFLVTNYEALSPKENFAEEPEDKTKRENILKLTEELVNLLILHNPLNKFFGDEEVINVTPYKHLANSTRTEKFFNKLIDKLKEGYVNIALVQGKLSYATTLEEAQKIRLREPAIFELAKAFLESKDIKLAKAAMELIQARISELTLAQASELMKLALLINNPQLDKLIASISNDIAIQKFYTDLANEHTNNKSLNQVISEEISALYKDDHYMELTIFSMIAQAKPEELNLSPQEAILATVKATPENQIFDAPLIMALKKGRDFIAEVLVARGADININDNHTGNTPLHYAAKSGNVDLIQILLSKGATIDAMNNEGQTPLGLLWANYVSTNGTCWNYERNRATVLLIENGASLAFFAFAIHKKLLQAAAEDGAVEVVKAILKRHPTLVRAEDEDGKTFLQYAIAPSRDEISALLIENGASINFHLRSSRGTLLHYAAKHNMLKTITALKNRGENLEAKDSKDRTPLLTALNLPHDEAAPLLLELGADPTAIDKDKNTALILAARNELTDSFELLQKKAKFDVTHMTKRGDTILLALLSNKKFSDTTIIDFIEAGALLNVEYDSDTPLFLALHHERYDIAQKIIETAADVNYRNNDGNTALHNLAREYRKTYGNRKKLIQLNGIDFLLKYYPNLRIKNNNGETALFILLSNINDLRVDMTLENIALQMINKGAKLSSDNKVAEKKAFENLVCYLVNNNKPKELALLLENNTYDRNTDFSGITFNNPFTASMMLEDKSCFNLLIKNFDNINILVDSPFQHETRMPYEKISLLQRAIFEDSQSENSNYAKKIIAKMEEKKIPFNFKYTTKYKYSHILGPAALQFALSHGNFEIADLICDAMIKNGEDFTLENTHEKTALHYAVESKAPLDLFKKIAKHSTEINQAYLNETPLLLAIWKKNTESIDYLLTELVQNKYMSTFDPSTVLHTLIQSDLPEQALNLLKLLKTLPNKEITQRDASYRSKNLTHALEKNYLDVAKELIKLEGVNFNYQNDKDETPLGLAMKLTDKTSSKEICQLLVARGAKAPSNFAANNVILGSTAFWAGAIGVGIAALIVTGPILPMALGIVAGALAFIALTMDVVASVKRHHIEPVITEAVTKKYEDDYNKAHGIDVEPEIVGAAGTNIGTEVNRPQANPLHLNTFQQFQKGFW